MIYIDSNFKCHVENDGTMIAIQTDFFNGKCKEFIEGYLLVPQGRKWMRKDGVIFTGEMIAPWKSYEELDIAQRRYEQEQLQALNILLGEKE